VISHGGGNTSMSKSGKNGFRNLAVISVLALSAVASIAAQTDPLESALIKTAVDSEHAVLGVWYQRESDPAHFATMVGSAFLINADGYFVTAGHVVQPYQPSSALTVMIKQRGTDSASGIHFDVVESDPQHDVALCRASPFIVRKPDSANPKQTMFPISTLDVSSETLQTGEFVAIVGFPLISWDAAVRFGNIAATRTANPQVASMGGLMQISASGNAGDVGGPVISLRTGKVVGMIVETLGAPALVPETSRLEQFPTVLQKPGIILAMPASRIRDLLVRTHVTSQEHKPEENLGID
jgi:S1-C subfamily serine protease